MLCIFKNKNNCSSKKVRARALILSHTHVHERMNKHARSNMASVLLQQTVDTKPKKLSPKRVVSPEPPILSYILPKTNGQTFPFLILGFNLI